MPNGARASTARALRARARGAGQTPPSGAGRWRGKERGEEGRGRRRRRGKEEGEGGGEGEGGRREREEEKERGEEGEGEGKGRRGVWAEGGRGSAKRSPAPHPSPPLHPLPLLLPLPSPPPCPPLPFRPWARAPGGPPVLNRRGAPRGSWPPTPPTIAGYRLSERTCVFVCATQHASVRRARARRHGAVGAMAGERLGLSGPKLLEKIVYVARAGTERDLNRALRGFGLWGGLEASRRAWRKKRGVESAPAGERQTWARAPGGHRGPGRGEETKR